MYIYIYICICIYTQTAGVNPTAPETITALPTALTTLKPNSAFVELSNPAAEQSGIYIILDCIYIYIYIYCPLR